ncbi:hypothetical protein ES703_124232 [subsurface metagenome]
MNSKGEALKDRQNYYLTSFAKEVNNLDPIQEPLETDIPKRTKFLTKITSLINPLTSANIFILFVSWLFLLTVLFVTSVKLSIN